MVDSSTHRDQARTQSSYAAVETRDASESPGCLDSPAAGTSAGEEAEAEGEGDRVDGQANSADKYLSLVVYLSYLVLPSVTTTIFSAFPFIDMNPSKVTGLPVPDKYLAADFSIVYDSPRYWQGVSWAIAMIAVYPVGIPLFYFCLLYYNKQSIMEFKQLEIAMKEKETTDGNQSSVNEQEDNKFERKEQDTARDTGGGGGGVGAESAQAQPPSIQPDTAANDKKRLQELKKTLAPIFFLFKSYEGKFWYWELVETVRRLLLTAVLAVISPGSPVQIVVGISLSIVYIKLYSQFQPYDDDSDDAFQELAQWQIFVTLFGSLLLQARSLPPKYSDPVIGTFLFIANCASFVSMPYFAYLEVQHYLHGDVNASNANDNGDDADDGDLTPDDMDLGMS